MRPNCASKWVVRKNGYFYRPGNKGYTVSVMEAGLYSEEDAKTQTINCEGVTAHPLVDFTENPEYKDQSWPNLK